MLSAEVIYPNKVKSRTITCADCGVEYPNSDYTVLFKSFKISYFETNSSELPSASATLCHECLLNSILYASEVNGNVETSFTIMTKDHEYTFNFHPEESANPEGDDSPEDFLRGLFADDE